MRLKLLLAADAHDMAAGARIIEQKKCVSLISGAGMIFSARYFHK